MTALKKDDIELVNEAKRILNLRKSSYSKTGCAIRVQSGKVFSAVNIRIHNSAPCSICAEQAAIGKAVSEGYDKIVCLVSVGDWKGTNGVEIISPCGMCRQFVKQFGNPFFIIKNKNKLVKKKLNALLPD